MPFDEHSDEHGGGGGGGGRHEGLDDLALMVAHATVGLANRSGKCPKCLLIAIGGAILAQTEAIFSGDYDVESMPSETRERFEADLRKRVLDGFEETSEAYGAKKE